MTTKTMQTPPTLAELATLPFSQVQDYAGRKTARTGATRAIRYKIADCADEYASRAIVIDWPRGTRQVIRSCDTVEWSQFIHRGC